MNVFVSSGEPVTSSFSYADWKDDFTNICGSSVCGEITFEFDVYYKKDSTDPQDLLNVMDNSNPATHSYSVTKPSTEEYQLSIETTLDAYGGTYKIKVKGTLDCLVITGLSDC